MNVIRRKRRVVLRRPMPFQCSGLWAPCTERGEPAEGEPVELGNVVGRLHRSFHGCDVIHVTEGENKGWWKPV